MAGVEERRTQLRSGHVEYWMYHVHTPSGETPLRDHLPKGYIQQDQEERILHPAQNIKQRSDTDRKAAST